MLQKSGDHHLRCIKPVVNYGTNYQAQLISRISEPSIVSFQLVGNSKLRPFQESSKTLKVGQHVSPLRMLRNDASGQIIATSHGAPKRYCFGREVPLFQGNLGWWNIIIWPDTYFFVSSTVQQSEILVSYVDACNTWLNSNLLQYDDSVVDRICNWSATKKGTEPEVISMSFPIYVANEFSKNLQLCWCDCWRRFMAVVVWGSTEPFLTTPEKHISKFGGIPPQFFLELVDCLILVEKQPRLGPPYLYNLLYPLDFSNFIPNF